MSHSRPRVRKHSKRLELTQLCSHRFWLKQKEGPNMVNGWVTFASDEKLALEIHGRCQFHEGEEALCSISHQWCTAQFIVEVVSVLPSSLVVRPLGVMHIPEKGEDPRRKVQLDIQVNFGDADVLARVVDVSVGGMGLIVPAQAPLHSDIECEFSREGAATIILRGNVAYCKPLHNHQGFRVGVALAKLDRLDQARWKKYVREGETILVRSRLPA